MIWGSRGGLPFTPGNTSSGDLLFATKPEWLTPESFSQIAQLCEMVTGELHEAPSSHATPGSGRRSRPTAWYTATALCSLNVRRSDAEVWGAGKTALRHSASMKVRGAPVTTLADRER
jgi:hypothetical protein